MRAIADALPPSLARGGPRTDHELMWMSLDHPDRFAEIFDRHAAAIHGYLSRRVADLADDLLNETFLTAFRKRADYRPDRLDVRPWLYGIAANLVRRHQRAELARYRAVMRSAERDASDDATEDTDAALGRVDAQRLTARLAVALADLHVRDREVLLLVAWGDLTYSEVSAALDIPVGTVRSRLNRARQQVRARLELTPGQPGRAAPRSPFRTTSISR